MLDLEQPHKRGIMKEWVIIKKKKGGCKFFFFFFAPRECLFLFRVRLLLADRDLKKKKQKDRQTEIYRQTVRQRQSHL
jgi:hypothetical protein